MIGIYKIINKINGKIYIGQSINIEDRWKQEKSGKYINKHLLSAFKKYGIENFKFEVITECREDNLSILEQTAILLAESYKPENGYNKTFGGEGGKRTEETRVKMSEAKTGEKNPFYGKTLSEETRAKISEAIMKNITDETRVKMSEANTGEKNPFYGKAHSEDTREKISASHCGKTHSEETKVKISVANKGKTLSEEHRAKISAAGKGKTYSRIVCPHCGRTGGINTMYRWHFDNCKYIMKDY